MGLFNFLKDVGETLMHHDAPKASVAPGAEAPAADHSSLEQMLMQQLQKLDLGIESPKVTVQGDKAVLEGSVSSPEALEKAILALGNIKGIAQVESKVQGAEPSSQFYTVKSGDTLSKISKEVYGDANRYNDIFNANRPMLKSADAIYPGQQLRIPQAQKQAA